MPIHAANTTDPIAIPHIHTTCCHDNSVVTKTDEQNEISAKNHQNSFKKYVFNVKFAKFKIFDKKLRLYRLRPLHLSVRLLNWQRFQADLLS